MFGPQMTLGSTVTANPETVEGMLESLGEFFFLMIFFFFFACSLLRLKIYHLNMLFVDVGQQVKLFFVFWFDSCYDV